MRAFERDRLQERGLEAPHGAPAREEFLVKVLLGLFVVFEQEWAVWPEARW